MLMVKLKGILNFKWIWEFLTSTLFEYKTMDSLMPEETPTPETSPQHQASQSLQLTYELPMALPNDQLLHNAYSQSTHTHTQTHTHIHTHTIFNEMPNELWINVFTYLPIADLQQVRLVCKRWSDLANLPKFKNKLRLQITRENLDELVERLQQQPHAVEQLNFQNVEVRGLKCSDELQYVLSRIGRHVRMLTLHRASVFSNLHGNLPNLHELSIKWIRVIPGGEILKSVDLRSFEKLKSLNLACCGLTRSVQSCLLRQLTGAVEHMPQLEQLHMQSGADQEKHLLHVLATHAETLKHISFNFFSTPMLEVDSWLDLSQHLHQLHTIKLTGHCLYEWLDVIFNNVPDTVQLRNIDLSGILHVNDTLLRLIVCKWPRSLEALELMFCVAISDEGMTSLAQLRHNLRVLNLSFTSHITKRGLLDGIACQRNTVMRKLYLDDVHELDEQCVCLLAERLPNLELLSLGNCRKAVTDTSLAHIFRYQTRLQYLSLDDCISITDRGLIGFGEEPYSVSRLTGLQMLSLRGCRKISNGSLIHAFKFSELRVLQLGYCQMITTKGVQRLVVNCPALESLVISSCLMLDDDAVLYITKGLKRLRKLNVSNCANLTELSVTHIIENCESLQALTMCGIDSLEVHGVQKRLFALKPHLKTLNL